MSAPSGGGICGALELCKHLQEARPWSDFSVGEQLMGVLHEMLSRGPRGDSGGGDEDTGLPCSNHSSKEGATPVPARSRGAFSRFDDVVIPWGGLAGVTLFARIGSTAEAWLRVKDAAPGIEVPLLMYEGKVAKVQVDLAPPSLKGVI